jgi:hypothetical protein
MCLCSSEPIFIGSTRQHISVILILHRRLARFKLRFDINLFFHAQSAPEFVAPEQDLESDEALWALYERWCKAFNQKRDHDEMVRRFSKFKETVLLVHHVNNDNRPYKLAINKFADGKLMQLCRNHDKLDVLLSKLVGKSPCSFIYRGGGRFLRQVFADYKVVNGKVFVTYPTGSKSGCQL